MGTEWHPIDRLPCGDGLFLLANDVHGLTWAAVREDGVWMKTSLWPRVNRVHVDATHFGLVDKPPERKVPEVRTSVVGNNVEIGIVNTQWTPEYWRIPFEWYRVLREAELPTLEELKREYLKDIEQATGDLH